MTEDTIICPACSAPLEIADSDQTVECGFCGDSFDIVRDGDALRLELHSQPQPQADTLAQASQAAVEDLREETAETLAETYPGTIRRAEGEPVAPRFASSATQAAAPEAFAASTAAGLDREPFEVVQPVSPAPVPPAARGRNPWIILGLTVFVVACLVLLCAAGGILMFMRGSGLETVF